MKMAALMLESGDKGEPEEEFLFPLLGFGGRQFEVGAGTWPEERERERETLGV